MYAEVAVNVLLGPWSGGKDSPPPTYHYRVPAPLVGQLSPGHMVRVPFGARPAQGIVLALTVDRPANLALTQIRDIASIADPTPVLTPPLLDLARWMAEATLTPLGETVWSFVPAGIEERAHVVAALTADGAQALETVTRLGPVQRALLNALAEHGPTRQDELSALAGVRSTDALTTLVKRGLVERRWGLDPPTLKARTVQVARLAADAATVVAARATLGRDTPAARALTYLTASADPLPTLAAVTEGGGVKVTTLRRLAERGLIGVTERRALVALRVSRGEAQRRLAATSPETLRDESRALLHALLARPTPLDMDELARLGLGREALRPLSDGGLIQAVDEPAAVFLAAPPEEVANAILELRKGAGQARLLDLLRDAGAEMEVRALLKAAGASADDLAALRERDLVQVEERIAWRDPLAGETFALSRPPELTGDQARVWDAVASALRAPEPSPAFLLHGVTGSGKTEVYLRAVGETLSHRRQALILVPEISLTPQTVRRFAARFPGRVTLLHSRLSAGERYDTWQRIRSGQIDVVIGSRSALFAPLPRLGLVVVDEEHDPSYKQDNIPRYHAREAALRLGAASGAVTILGSATPDIETYARTERGELRLLRLPRRVLGHRSPAQTALPDSGNEYAHDDAYGELPPVEVVDLRAELRAGNTSMFSRALQSALRETKARGEQAILFLNRRGSATFVMCRDCGHVVTCPRCSAPLTYHGASGYLVCHHCGTRAEAPTTCPVCGSARIRHFGAGTQRVEETLLALLPQARVIRWDRDTTGPRASHAQFLDAFIQGDADVLIGTQMIAKGLDLPLVTLVGVISADVGLNLPDFRAAERTFQLLAQVAGRAARGPLGGRVIFQTYTPDHYAIETAARHDYEAFYAAEMDFRRATGYPPYSRLARLLYTDPTAERAATKARALARRLTDYIRRQGLPNTTLIGPAPAYFARERGEYRWHILVRGSDPTAVLRGFLSQERAPYGWRVDIDPVSVL